MDAYYVCIILVITAEGKRTCVMCVPRKRSRNSAECSAGEHQFFPRLWFPIIIQYMCDIYVGLSITFVQWLFNFFNYRVPPLYKYLLVLEYTAVLNT